MSIEVIDHSRNEVIHYGPDAVAPEFPVEVWEPSRNATLLGGTPNAEAVVYGYRYRNDEHGRLWQRAFHGSPDV